MPQVLLFAVVSAVLLNAAPAFACSRIPATSVTPRGGFAHPIEGAHVASNARVWLVEDSGSASAVELRDSAGAVVPTTRTLHTISGEAPSILTMLTPVNALPNGSYLFVAPTVNRAFIVDQPADTSAPAAPTGTAQSGGSGGCGSSPPSAVVALGATPDVFTLAVADGTPITPFPTAILGISSTKSLTAFDVPSGALKFNLVTVDLSGNVSDATTISTNIAPQGCSVAGPWLMAWLAPLALLRRRTR